MFVVFEKLFELQKKIFLGSGELHTNDYMEIIVVYDLDKTYYCE